MNAIRMPMSSCMAVPPHFRAWMSDGALLLIAAVMSCKTYPLLYKIPQFNARADFKSCRISVDSGENMRIIRIYQGNAVFTTFSEAFGICSTGFPRESLRRWPRFAVRSASLPLLSRSFRIRATVPGCSCRLWAGFLWYP